MIMQHFVSRRRLYLAFLVGFHAAKPITYYQNHNTSKRGKTKIQRTKRNEGPAAPKANQVAHDKTKDAKTKIQNEAPETSAAYQMVYGAIKQGNEQGK